MGAAFDDSAVLQDHDDIRVLNGRQTVSDHENRPSLHDGIHALLDEFLGSAVNRGSGFVQNENGGVRASRPGDGYQLTLALR